MSSRYDSKMLDLRLVWAIRCLTFRQKELVEVGIGSSQGKHRSFENPGRDVNLCTIYRPTECSLGCYRSSNSDYRCVNLKPTESRVALSMLRALSKPYVRVDDMTDCQIAIDPAKTSVGLCGLRTPQG